MIQNDHFAASFDTQTGTISVRRSDGTPFLTAGAACANTDAGKQSTASPGREHSVDTSAFRDRLGSGRAHGDRLPGPAEAARLARGSRFVRPSADGDDRDALHQRLVTRRGRHESGTDPRPCERRGHAPGARRRDVHHQRGDVLRRGQDPRFRSRSAAGLSSARQGGAARERVDRAAPRQPSPAGGTSGSSAATTARAWCSGILRTR